MSADQLRTSGIRGIPRFFRKIIAAALLSVLRALRQAWGLETCRMSARSAPCSLRTVSAQFGFTLKGRAVQPSCSPNVQPGSPSGRKSKVSSSSPNLPHSAWQVGLKLDLPCRVFVWVCCCSVSSGGFNRTLQSCYCSFKGPGRGAPTGHQVLQPWAINKFGLLGDPCLDSWQSDCRQHALHLR